MTSEEFHNTISGMLACGIDQRTICSQFWHFLQWSQGIIGRFQRHMNSCYLMPSIEDKRRHFICSDEPDTAWALFYSFAE
ncbi:unnamed protein product [Sphagnum compactum]